MENILRFDLSPSQLKFKNILNKEFIELEIWAISDINPNRNNSHFTLESLEASKDNVKNKPIVGFFENNDFTTHEGKADYDSEYQKQYWNTEKGERILGWVRESDPVEIVEKDGLHWLKFRCILCTTYCYRQVKRLLKDKKKKVSVEVTVHKNEIVNGVEYIHEFTLNGVTILGSKNGKAVLEGIPGAHLSVLENLDDDVMREQRRILSFAYKQIDEAKDENIVAGNIDMGDENIEKEVNQADMNTVDVEKVEETLIIDETAVVDEVDKIDETDINELQSCDNKVDLACDDNNIAEADKFEDQSDDKTEDNTNDDADDADDDSDDKDDDSDDDKSDDDSDKDNGDKDESLSAGEIPTSDDVIVEDVAVVEVAPDVNVIVEDDTPVNEGDDSLSMTTVDIGVPQCEEPPVVEDCGEPAVEAVVDVIIADDEGKEVITVDNGFEAKCLELEAKCAELECKLAEKESIIEDYRCKFETKCAECEEITKKFEAADEKIKDHFYSDLKASAIQLMAEENINKQYYNSIVDNCENRKYSCEDEIKKDIAIAIYSSRPAKEKKFSISIPVVEDVVVENKPKTREQRIKEYIGK